MVADKSQFTKTKSSDHRRYLIKLSQNMNTEKKKRTDFFGELPQKSEINPQNIGLKQGSYRNKEAQAVAKQKNKTNRLIIKLHESKHQKWIDFLDKRKEEYMIRMNKTEN